MDFSGGRAVRPAVPPDHHLDRRPGIGHSFLVSKPPPQLRQPESLRKKVEEEITPGDEEEAARWAGWSLKVCPIPNWAMKSAGAGSASTIGTTCTTGTASPWPMGCASSDSFTTTAVVRPTLTNLWSC